MAGAEGVTDRDEEFATWAAPEGASMAGRPGEDGEPAPEGADGVAAGRPAEAGKTVPEGADGAATNELSETGTDEVESAVNGAAADELSTPGTNAGVDRAVETRAEPESSAGPEGVSRSPSA